MAPARYFRSYPLLLTLCLVFAPLRLLAQVVPDAPQPDVENAKFQIAGLVNTTAFVRSGPSENDYATSKLEKGAQVTVVGERFNWLKIQPPEDSFCYVAKAYVNRAGNGSVGQVTGSAVYVRVGSALNSLKTKVATKLEPGQKVVIIGEQDEYFKVKPPEEVFFFISKQFVDPVKNLTGGAEEPKPAEQRQQEITQREQTKPEEPKAADDATTQPVKIAAEDTVKPAPVTQPTATVEAEFQRLEEAYAQITQQPLDEQPCEELLAGYQKLAASEGLPESLKRICDFKASVLKSRVELKLQAADVKKNQETMKTTQMALKAEQGELEKRVKDAEVVFYTACGTLRTSSLQQGQQTLYRLTDPSNGRTVVYLRSDDNKLGQMLGQFIGVRGEVVEDPQINLRTITPTFYENVNPSKVGQSVAAQIVPSSLLPGGTGTASGRD